MNEGVSFLTLPDRRLAYQLLPDRTEGKAGKPLIFLSGYASDMNGTKASFLAEKCQATGRGLLRFDYRGHGQSSGEFIDGTIGSWFDDALQAFDKLTRGPQILVGSSMGGWISLLLARTRPERVAGFVGIAAAPDFTSEIIEPKLTEDQKKQLQCNGFYYNSSDPNHAVPVTQKLMEESQAHFVLRSPLVLNGPVHLLQGQKDNEVPWQFALRIAEHISAPSVRITLIKDADHRLSRPQDLEILWKTIEGIG